MRIRDFFLIHELRFWKPSIPSRLNGVQTPHPLQEHNMWQTKNPVSVNDFFIYNGLLFHVSLLKYPSVLLLYTVFYQNKNMWSWPHIMWSWPHIMWPWPHIMWSWPHRIFMTTRQLLNLKFRTHAPGMVEGVLRWDIHIGIPRGAGEVEIHISLCSYFESLQCVDANHWFS